jgi:hypothetical protein
VKFHPREEGILFSASYDDTVKVRTTCPNPFDLALHPWCVTAQPCHYTCPVLSPPERML